MHLSYLKIEPISDIPQGRVIRCWVIDPAKLDVFQKFEEVELKKIESNKILQSTCYFVNSSRGKLYISAFEERSNHA